MELKNFLKDGFDNYQDVFETMIFFRTEMLKLFEESIDEHRKENADKWPALLLNAKISHASRSALEQWFSVDIKNKDQENNFMQVQVGLSWLPKKGLNNPRLHAARWIHRGEERIGKIENLPHNSEYEAYNEFNYSRLTPKTGPLKFEDGPKLKQEIKKLLSELLQQF